MQNNYNLILVNQKNPLTPDFIPANLRFCRIPWDENTKASSKKHYMTSEAASMLEYLCATARKNSICLTGISAYRSYNRQQYLYEHSTNNAYIAPPGTSEHQTGLAIDISTPDIQNVLEDIFEQTDAYHFLMKQGARYGFILRYPKGMENITGYPFEPWHFRYVGRNVALTILENGICLEQYFSLQKD